MKWLAEILLNQKQKKLKRKVVTHNFHSAKSALVLFDASTEKQRRVAIDFARFLKEEGIKTSTIGFFSLKGKNVQKPQDELSYHYLDSKDLNWLKEPKTDKANSFIKTDFDLMFDLNVEEHFPLQYASALSKAKFKLGASGSYRDQTCDLTIHFAEPQVENLIKELKKYLKMLNRKTA